MKSDVGRSGCVPLAMTACRAASMSVTKTTIRFQPTFAWDAYATPTGLGVFHSTRWIMGAVVSLEGSRSM